MLFVSKFKLCSSVGLASMGLASVPATSTMMSEASESKYHQPVDTAKDLMTNNFNDTMGNSLQTQYTTFGKDTYNNIGNSHTKTQEGLTQGPETFGSGLTTIAKEHSKDINFYAFHLGTLLKSLIKHVPMIVSDSVSEATFKPTKDDKGKEDKPKLFGFNKISEIAHSPKLKETGISLIKVLLPRLNLFSTMSEEDVAAVIDQLKRRPAGKSGNENSIISKYLKQIQDRADKIEDSKNFCTASALMLALFQDSNRSINNVNTKFTKIKQLMQQVESALSKKGDISLQQLFLKFKNITIPSSVDDSDGGCGRA